MVVESFAPDCWGGGGLGHHPALGSAWGSCPPYGGGLQLVLRGQGCATLGGSSNGREPHLAALWRSLPHPAPEVVPWLGLALKLSPGLGVVSAANGAGRVSSGANLPRPTSCGDPCPCTQLQDPPEQPGAPPAPRGLPCGLDSPQRPVSGGGATWVRARSMFPAGSALHVSGGGSLWCPLAFQGADPAEGRRCLHPQGGGPELAGRGAPWPGGNLPCQLRGGQCAGRGMRLCADLSSVRKGGRGQEWLWPSWIISSYNQFLGHGGHLVRVPPRRGCVSVLCVGSRGSSRSRTSS